MNKAQKQFKEYAVEHMSVDKIVCRANGTVELRRNYFYRHGNTAEMWGEKIGVLLPEGWEVVQTRDRWQAWPKDSYFLAITKQKEA